jgi:transposase
MSKKESNTYSSEFKESAVKLVLNSDQPLSATARELGVNKNTLHTWVSKYSKPVEGQQTRTDDHLYEELKRLKKENIRLKEERDILKKAAAYFAKEIR